MTNLNNQLDYSNMPMHHGFTSAIVTSTTANQIMVCDGPFTHTYRTYVKLREEGNLKLKFWHNNAIDSTWDQGQVTRASDLGGEWTIISAYVADGGTEPNGGIIADSSVQLTFEGESSKEVLAGENFCSDEALFHLPEGHYLAFTWTISTKKAGRSFTYNVEGMLVTGYDGEGHLSLVDSAKGFTLSENKLVFPSFLGYEKHVDKQVVFLGDSITQGVRTERDQYEYWVARIANAWGTNIGVWNLGSGWGRAYDVVTNGSWLHKAKQGDELIICLGVNDIDIGQRSAEQLLTDLSYIVSEVKTHNPAIKIILFTVPTFNFSEEREDVWRLVNEKICERPPVGVDEVFNIAQVLSQPAPLDHLQQPHFMSSEFDPHPNGIAGKAIADAFLQWYESKK